MSLTDQYVMISDTHHRSLAVCQSCQGSAQLTFSADASTAVSSMMLQKIVGKYLLTAFDSYIVSLKQGVI